jgi:hypothetical protein
MRVRRLKRGSRRGRRIGHIQFYSVTYSRGGLTVGPKYDGRTSNSTGPIISYCGDFGHRTLIDRVISLAKKRLSGKLLRRIPFDWVRVLCGPHIMQAIPLQRPLGWPSVLWSDFPAAEDAIASKQLDILSGGIAVPCVQFHPNRCECSAAGLGGRTRSPDPPRWRVSGPWQTNIPPVYAPFAFTCPPSSVMLG